MADDRFMACPSCGHDRIAVAVTTWCDYETGEPVEFDPEDVPYVEPRRDPDAEAVCRACGHAWLFNAVKTHDPESECEKIARAAGYCVIEASRHPSVFLWAKEAGVVSITEFDTPEEAWRGCVAENCLGAHE